MTTPTLGRPPDRSDMLNINRTTLRVWEWGDPDHAPIICAHGAYDHGRMFDEIGSRIADLGYRVQAVDARGHGDSGRLSSGHSWDAMVVDIAVLARSFDTPVGLVGHSMGAGIVTQVAATFPELVRFVINIDGLGPTSSMFGDSSLQEFASMSVGQAMRTNTRGGRRFPDQASMAEQRGKINYRMPKEWTEHLAEHGSVEGAGGWQWKWDPKFALSMPSGYSAESATVDFPLAVCPVLVFTGAEEDQWGDMPADEAVARVAKFPDARHHRMTGGGHYLHLEKPDETMEHISAFLDEVDATARAGVTA